MKRVFILIVAIFFVSGLKAQPWMENISHEKLESGEVTFYDIQDAFNEYWEPFNVEKGYYEVDGEKQKAGGWKQFKRWEWYWENRIDPKTGAFPNKSAMEVFQEYLQQSQGARSTSGNWTSMGPSTTGGGYAGLGRLNCIGFHPTDNNTFYVGAASGGVWKTSDGGSTWTPISDSIGALGVSDIIVEATAADDILYIATGDRDHSDTYSIGVLKSTDGGATWVTTGLTWTQSQYNLINRLLRDPTNSNIFYAATDNGLYKSTDTCTNWSLIYSAQEFIDLEFKPGDPQTLYGSNWNGDIYKSTNSGSTWSSSLTTNGKRTQLAVSSNDPTVVYAVMANSSNALKGVYKSTDSGSSFSLVYNSVNMLGWSCDGSGGGGQGWYDLCIIADPNQANTVFVGGVNTWKSTDGGSSWVINNHWSNTCGGIATTVHADKHYFAYQNGTSTLFECNDGGLYSTSDAGANWSHLGSGLIISQIYRLGVAQTTPDDVICGLQDNGTKALLTNVWDDVIGGDGMECLIDYSNSNTQYGELYYGDIYRTTNHWSSKTLISGGISGNAAWVTPYVQDPNSSNTLYVGYQDVWKSTNQGNSWSQISNWGSSTLKSLAVAPSNSSTIYAATNGTLYATTNGGSSWSDITGSLPTGSANITYISVKDDDPNTVWVSMSGFNSYGVFQSTNGGSSWSNISTGLPSLPVNSVIQNHQNNTDVELYAGTDVGVYIKVGSANWTAFFDGLPNVVVNELDIYYDNSNPSNSRIRAATYGRGLWESDLYSTSPVPVADFTADDTNPTIEDTVSFTDLSTNTPTSWAWTFTPSTVTYLEGTSSSSQNPEVRFDATGLYTVSLTATNTGGSGTETKTDYINATDPAPVADFSADNTNPTTIDTVAFTDMSTNNPTSWTWDFTPATITYMDGTNANSQHPKVRFDATGLYTVSLTAINAGGSGTETKTDYVDVTDPAPVADFSADNTSPTTEDTVAFTDMSTNNPTSWSWDFTPSTITYMDGTSANSQNPNVRFDATGLYTVELTATNAGGSGTEIKTDYINAVDPAPVADFSADNTNPTTDDTVAFTDLSTNNPTSWTWDFDPATVTYVDGTNANSQNPKVRFDATGNYTVTLTATNASGSGTETKTDYIQVTDLAPVADFSADNTNPSTGETVSFTDLSLNTPTSWDWSFDPATITYMEGTSSASQNPKVRFDEAGLYTVTLIATNAAGSSTETKTDYIEAVVLAPVADFSADNLEPTTDETVKFSDLSVNAPASWAWSFTPATITYMEGTGADSQNPMVRFDEPGKYTVSLTATNTGGSGTETKIDYINALLIGIGDNSLEDIAVWAFDQHVYITLPPGMNAEIEIYNLQGIKILQKEIAGRPVMMNQSGFFIVRLITDQGVKVVKIFLN